MDLNLDGLTSLAKSTAPVTKDPSTTPTEPQTASGEYKNPSEREKPAESHGKGYMALQREADKNLDGKQAGLEVYKTYQENTRNTGRLQAEILSGIRTGEDIYRLFLKAAEALSLTVNNGQFLRQVEAEARSIYGRGLGYKRPLQDELQDTRHRLTRLEAAYNTETAPEDKKRIEAAINAHREQIKALEKRISEAP